MAARTGALIFMLAGKSAAAETEQVAKTADVVLPIVQIRFITFLFALIVWG